LPISIQGGDFISFWKENFISLFNSPFLLWDSAVNLGLHTNLLIHYDLYKIVINLFFPLLVKNISFYEKLFIIIPFLILVPFCFYYFLIKSYFSLTFTLVGLFVFTLNTYILMISQGGQIAGLGIAYAFLPLVFLAFINFKKNTDSIRAVILAFSVTLMTIFDIRYAYIAFVSLFILFFLTIPITKRSLTLFGLFLVVYIGFNIYWILPLIANFSSGINQFGGAYTSVNALEYFSVAKLPQTFSFLHPNWPENIFGKVYLMRPEFLMIPIIAFIGLLFIKNKKITNYELRITNVQKSINNNTLSINSTSLYLAFSVVALVGIFLAKGVNPPFGFIYSWCFEHIPGFVMFRDPTKFYVMIAISYAYMIPFSILQLSNWVSKKFKIINLKFEILFSIIFILYWLVLIKPAWTGQLGGTFKPHPMPNEYVKLKDFIYNQNTWFRTYWVPIRQRFGYFSDTNPAIDSVGLLQAQNEGDVYSFLQDKGPEYLIRWGVKYVIVPFDSEGEIFTKDYIYNPKQRDQLVASMSAVAWLKKNTEFKEIGVYEIEKPKDKFFLENPKSEEISWEMVSPVKYRITINNEQINEGNKRFVFSETYDPKWRLSGKGIIVYSEKTYDGLNSFIIPAKNGTYELYYTPQKYVWIGLTISGIMAFCAILFLLAIRITKKSHIRMIRIKN
jgi:hypothetical protein